MKDDAATLAALGILAMCLVTISHEAIGHGAACLIIGGKIVHVSSTLFACSVPNAWVAAGGPFGDLALGFAAAAAVGLLPRARTSLRFFLAAVAAFSLFWETGYLVKAMVFRDGDLYFFAYGFLGQYGIWPLIGAAIGAVLYVTSIAVITRIMSDVFGDATRAKAAGRIIWLAATTAAIIAALPFKGELLPALRDAGLEIGLAAVPLLYVRVSAASQATPHVGRNVPVIVLSACILMVFAAALGHGLGRF